jgi:phage terminase large subunit-like protein
MGYGERAVTFLRRLKHPKNPARGHPFQLDPWQERIVRRIYGPRHSDGRRIVETVLLLLPRGNRKTSLAAALALLHTIGPERLPSGEVDFAASDKKQAAIGFREVTGIVRADPRIAKECRISDAVNSTKRLVFTRDQTFLETLSSDAATQHGRTPTFALVDELHAWKGRDLWEVITSGLPKTAGSLMVIATTAGRGQENVCFELVDYARKIARGELHNESFLPILFEASADDNWQDEALWHRVNPGLRYGYPSLEGLRKLAREAKDRPGDREAFKQLNLNVWLDSSLSPFLDMALYDTCAEPIELDTLAGKPCWIAVDMSSTTDMTAVVACFKDDGGYVVVPFLFVPGDNLRACGECDQAPYVQWAEQGYIKGTAGNAIDPREIEHTIRDLCERFDVREIAFDRAYAQPVMGPLLDDGFPVVTMQLGWVTQSPALNELERAVISGAFKHDGNPALRHCFANVSIRTDTAGNRTMHKGKSTGRIDGAFATWMAVARAAVGDSNRSLYDDPNISVQDLVW